MENKENHPTGYYLSRGISYILHPLTMPMWVLVILFASGIIPVYIPVQIRNYLLTVVGINTLLVPVLAIIMMRMFGLIPDYSISSRSDRTLPLIIMAVGYGVCAWMLSSVPMFILLQRIMWAAMLATVFALCVNFAWQISLHMTAVGAVVGALFILILAGYGSMIWVFSLSVMCAGALASARLYLGKHTPKQIAAGFFGGFFIALAVLLLWR